MEVLDLLLVTLNNQAILTPSRDLLAGLPGEPIQFLGSNPRPVVANR